MRQFRSRAIGLLASLAIILLIIGAPIALVAIGVAPWDLQITQAGTLLHAPDDGHLAMALVAGAAWVGWVVLFFALATEIVSRIRGIDTPRVPHLALPQRFAGRLVAVASLLFVAVPTIGPAAATSRAHAVDSVPSVQVADYRITAPEESAAAPSRPSVRTVDSTAKDSTIEHTVKPGETLWKIAERHLGDGSRWREIFERNQETLGDRPDFIRPGTLIRIPRVDENGRPTANYVVRPGDTLSGIAQRTLGDPSRHVEIFEASRNLAQSTGERLTDPDRILPGWRLSIPGSGEKELRAPFRDETPESPRRESAGTPRLGSEPPLAGPSAPQAEPDHEVAPSWLVPGLAGAGAMLAGGLLLTLRSQLRGQLRYRHPGKVVPPPPENLRNMEKSARACGAATANLFAQLDRRLKHLAAATQDGGHARDLLFAELSDESLTLHLRERCELPEPWDGGGTIWSAPLNADVEDLDQIPPFPLLVTIGQSNDGHLWLANLQAIGPVAITGDPESAVNLARHISAELILNPWASLVDVDLFGLGNALASLDPIRLHTHGTVDDPLMSRIADDLASRSSEGPPERFQVVVGVEPGESEALNRLVQEFTPRAGMAVIAVLPCDESGFTVLDVRDNQALRTDLLSVELDAAGLSAEEAAACAAIVDVTRVAAPPSNVAPTAPGDLTSVRPLLPGESRSTGESDPDLDRELQAWFDPACSLPRLILLGPVKARACGDARAVMKRKPYYTEVLAYLSLHPDGVTSAQLADDFGITPNRARIDMNAVRNWLGDNPRTGRRHVPDANASAAAVERGVAAYQVEDLLSDLDLFRRLRRRGEARGADGISDLVQALKLVTGQPFDLLRPGGWAWLVDGERLDHTMACAVVDVAHTVATHALSTDDVELAGAAAEIARRAAPHDEIATLDLVAALAAGGHEREAQKLLNDNVLNRRDDELGPIELPPRTADILRRHKWYSTKSDR